MDNFNEKNNLNKNVKIKYKIEPRELEQFYNIYKNKYLDVLDILESDDYDVNIINKMDEYNIFDRNITEDKVKKE